MKTALLVDVAQTLLSAASRLVSTPGGWRQSWSGTTILAVAALTTATLSAAGPDNDVLLRAMRDELARSRAIHLVNLEPPYFISYSLDDGESYTATATLGGLLNSRHDRFRLPEVEVRVGDYKFDNTNFAGGGSGSRYDTSRFPLENDYGVLRRFLWLSTDSAYKSAVEAISRKRAALRNVAASDRLNDFAHAEPVERIQAAGRRPFDDGPLVAMARSLSAIFGGFPQIRESSVETDVSDSIHYQVNTEGTGLRFADVLAFVRVRARAQAADGMLVHDAIVFHALDPARLAPEPEMRRGVTALAENLVKLVEAPMGDAYNGPILFEGVAAAQLFASVLGKNLALTRRPVGESGRGGGFAASSELEGRQGSRILPEFLTVVDDPGQSEWRGRPLIGHYEVDREGVVPQPLVLVDKGVLKSFLLTRQPVRGFEGSNGRALMPGAFGASTAGFGNLFVKATETARLGDLKKKLIEMCQNRGKPYGILVRKLDFPSSATFQEMRQMFGRGPQSNGSQRVGAPILVYRIYPDGREELIRGVRFGGLNVRSLKDIMAAGDDETVFEFLDNTAPLALMGAAGYVSEASVIAPSILIDDLELHKMDEELPKLPIVPAP